VWTYPGCPLRIRFSLRALERLRAQITPPQKPAAPAKTRQLGGLLLGLKNSRPGITDVVDFVPLLASVDPTSSQFGFVTEWLDEVSNRCPPEYKIVGYYRTSSDDSIQLTPDDLKLIQQRFADPSNVFLVIASGSRTATAAFFCQHNGAVGVNPNLTFPFSADELASGGWPIHSGEMLGDRLAHLAAVLRRVMRPGLMRMPGLWMRQSGLWSKGLSAALVIALVFTAGVLLKRSLGARVPEAAEAAAAPTFALHVERTGASFVLSWDPTTPQIATASGGSLEIHEGSKPVSLLSLTPEQLQLGTLSYGSYPYTDQAEFRLLIAGAAGAQVESSAVASPPIDSPAVADSAPPRPGPPTSLRAVIRVTRLPASDTQPEADSETEPQPPSIVPESPARTFVPPSAKAAAALAAPANIAIPEPPAPGRIRMPGNMLSWELANSLPINRTAPPPADAQESFVVRQPAMADSTVGLVTIISEPSGAAVRINDTLAGTTPVSLQMSPVGLGFTVTVTKSGFAKWTIQSVATDQPSSLHVRLRPNR